MRYFLLATFLVLVATHFVAKSLPTQKELVPVAEMMLRTMKP